MTTKLEQAAREVIRQHSMECLSDKTITDLREALAEQAEQEPVAEVVVRPLKGDQSHPTTDIKWLQRPTTGKLYTAPVRTKDLTDDEIFKLFYSDGKEPIDHYEFARAVIAADRAKNNLCGSANEEEKNK